MKPPKKVQRTSTGSKLIDNFLKGGVEEEIITNVFGESGSGKTNFAIQIAAQVAKDPEKGKVIYIDTEKGFSPERFIQIADEQSLEQIILYEPKNFEEQKQTIKNINKKTQQEDVSLIIIDSLVSLYRLEVNGDNVRQINQELSQQLSTLSKIARTTEIPIVVTNQVYTSFDEEKLELVGRDVPRYWSKCLIELSKAEKNLREIKIEKHRSLPEGRKTKFKITNKGLKKP